MKQPATHAAAHPMWCDRWNPYRKREYIGHLLDKAHFDALLDCDAQGRALHSIDALGAGCVDAPEEVPCGSTLCVHTIGGWDREEYARMPRDCDDYRARRRAEAGLAEMLKRILEETS